MDQGLAEDDLVEKEKGGQGLILAGGGDILLDHQVGQELFDFGAVHLLRMVFVMVDAKGVKRLIQWR